MPKLLNTIHVGNVGAAPSGRWQNGILTITGDAGTVKVEADLEVIVIALEGAKENNNVLTLKLSVDEDFLDTMMDKALVLRSAAREKRERHLARVGVTINHYPED